MNDSRSHEHDEIVRDFWAVYIGSTVESDGTVTRFREFWDRMTPESQAAADRFAYWTAVKCIRDGRSRDECVTAGIRALREHLRLMQPPNDVRPSVPAVRALVKTIIAGLDGGAR
ncbi:MAG: hypothetical protein ACT4PE_05465 [Candidatus Eiseniibacteriota bacterium]